MLLLSLIEFLPAGYSFPSLSCVEVSAGKVSSICASSKS